MALSVVNQWTGRDNDQDIELTTFPTVGNWLIAIVSSCVVDGSAPLLSLGDASRNLWTLLATDTKSANSTNTGAQIQVEVWACPAVKFDGWPMLSVYTAAMQITASDVGSVCVNVLEVSGFGNGWITVDSITALQATGTNSLSLAIPTPAADCFMLGVAATDNSTPSAIVPNGAGFFNLTQVSNAPPHLVMTSQWIESSTTQTASWITSPSTNTDWAAIAIAIRATGVAPAQPNPNWPYTQFQVGLGYDLSTPLPRVRWTDQTSRFFSLTGDRGIQQELGVAEQGTSDVVIRNDDGAYNQRPIAASASASAAGTTTTIKIPDASATNIHVTDFFRLQTSGGALKELNVFQVISTSSGGGTTTVTFTRADGSGGGALTATASGDVYAGIKIDLYMPYRQLMTWQGKSHVVASGWLRDLPIVYESAAWAEVNAVAGDAIETLTAASPSAGRGEILRRPGLYAYWPLDDSSGSGYAVNQSNVSTTTLVETQSKFGAGTMSADFGAATQNVQTSNNRVAGLLGDSGTGWAQDGGAAADLATKGYALIANDPNFPSVANGVTICGQMLVSSGQQGVIVNGTKDPTVAIVRNGGQTLIKLSFDHVSGANFGYPKITVWDKTTKASTTTELTTAFLVTALWVGWSLTFNQTSWALYVDGAGLAGSGACNLPPNCSLINIGGEADQVTHGNFFPGTHAHIAVYGRRLTEQETININDGLSSGALHLETTSGRVAKKLNTAGWQQVRVINAAPANVSAEGDPSGTIADIANEVSGYEDSLVFADAAGQLQYRARVRAYWQTPRATLGENAAGGEIPYESGMSPSFNPTFIYNTIEIDNTLNPGTFIQQLTTTTFVADDNTSVKKYNIRTLAKATRYSNLSDGFHIAWWWLARYAYPKQRVEQIVVDASGDPTRWPFVLGVEVGDLVTVNKRQIGSPAPMSFRCRVLRVQPNLVYGFGDKVSGSVTLTLAAAPAQVTITGDPVNGVVGNTVMGA